MDAHKYLLKYSQELSEEYPGKYLAIVDDKVAAVSSSGHESFEKAKNIPGKGDLYNLHANRRGDGDAIMRYSYGARNRIESIIEKEKMEGLR